MGSGRISAIAFVVSVALLAFLWGAAAIQYRIFPWPVLRDAKAAFDALAKLEDDTLLPGLRHFDPAAPASPRVSTLSPQAGREAILVTGGRYQFLERCPRFGCLAWVTDREGRVLWSWEVDWDALLAGFSGFAGDARPGNVYPVGITLLSGGELAVSFHGRNMFPYQAGMARIGRDGRVIWVQWTHAHHWITRDPAGNIYSPSAQPVDMPELAEGTAITWSCINGKVYDEGVEVRSPDGTVQKSFRIGPALVAAGWPGLLYGTRDGCDPYHVNAVRWMPAAIAAKVPGAAEGDLLVSLREPSAVALLDGETGAIKRLVAGRMAAQHGPVFLPDGTVAVFDNLGGDATLGGTRILRLDLVTGAAETLYPRTPDAALLPFDAPDGGELDVSPDGTRLMVSDKHGSRLFEIDVATGTPLWMLEQCSDISSWLAAQDMTRETGRACFNAYGGYYLKEADLAFLTP
jgi:hypothetical protein